MTDPRIGDLVANVRDAITWWEEVAEQLPGQPERHAARNMADAAGELCHALDGDGDLSHAANGDLASTGYTDNTCTDRSGS